MTHRTDSTDPADPADRGKPRARAYLGTEPSRFYDELEVGDIFEHRPGRTISEADNTWFSLLTMNPQPLHIDAEYSSRTEFGERLVNSCLTLSILVGLSVRDLSYKTIANLGWNDVRLTAPVFAGDTIYAASEVLAKRESKSRPAQGIVTVRTIGRKGDGTEFMSFERSFLLPIRTDARNG